MCAYTPVTREPILRGYGSSCELLRLSRVYSQVVALSEEVRVAHMERDSLATQLQKQTVVTGRELDELRGQEAALAADVRNKLDEVARLTVRYTRTYTQAHTRARTHTQTHTHAHTHTHRHTHENTVIRCTNPAGCAQRQRTSQPWVIAAITASLWACAMA